MRLRALLMVSALALFGAAARADDEIYVRGQEKPIKGQIKSESPKGITLAGGKDLIPADTINDVVYDVPEASVRLTIYRPALKAEKASLEATKDADRKAALADAIKKYDEVASKITATDPSSKGARRQAEFKGAVLRLRQVQEDGAPPETAGVKLKAFKEKHPSGWQVPRVLESLGRLQQGQGDFKAAEQTYRDLAQLDLSPEAKLDAQLLAVQAEIQDGRHAAALKELQALPVKDGPLAGRVKVAEAQCLAASKDKAGLKQAQDLLRGVLKEGGDRQVKAAAHNALGQILFDRGDYKDARWEFLWVDVVYNQDREEHARAIYYLWKTFEQLNDAVRAQECRESLLAPQFAGSDYQRQAQKAAKAAQ